MFSRARTHLHPALVTECPNQTSHCGKSGCWVIYSLLLSFLVAPLVQAADWPLHDAYWTISIRKDINATPRPHEPSDPRWFHMHRNHPTLPDSLQNTIAPEIVHGYDTLNPAASAIKLQYTVHGTPVSGWLGPPFRFVLKIDNPALSNLKDGIHDLSVRVQGNKAKDFKPWRAFVHLTRDKSSGEPYGFSKQVPIVNTPSEPDQIDADFGPGVAYVHPNERQHKGYPLNPSVTPWHQPPREVALYQEMMSPHTELFEGMQMWWDHPAHANAPFVRGFMAKHGEDHRNLRVDDAHERLPMMDGPRSIGWMSPYVTGQVDSQGRFAFAEVGGRVGYLMPDGEIITVAGWRVQPDKDPIWWGKPTAQVRANMENKGRWLNGRGEFHTPLDVAIDPKNERVWYVVGYEDHAIWQVTLPRDLRTQSATIKVFAGSPQHQPGLKDGSGNQARFNGPASIVFDPVNDVMYVADQDNNAIREVDRSGQVTTLFGGANMRQRLTAGGVTWTNQLASRAASHFEVTGRQASQGIQPDIYLPQTIRTDSAGNIIVLEVGFGAIRQIDPATGVTKKLGEVRQKHAEFDRGWAWLDVDRYGATGPADGIYWCKFVSTRNGERFNEVYSWLPPGGGASVPLFSPGTGLYPDGWGRRHKTNAPHYPWLIAIDPRGALLLGGGGEHGITRLRLRDASDPIEQKDYWLGRQVWRTASPLDNPQAGTSFALKYGWGGHNALGLTNAWGLTGQTDEQLLNAFNVPNSIRNDATSRQQWLTYVRPNTLSRDNPNGPTTQGDTPRLLTANASVTHRWRRIRFGSSLPAPIVIATSVSNNGTDPVTIRIRNVTADGFDVRIQEWDYLDDIHRRETFSYMAMSEGNYTLANGARVQAGQLSANTNQTKTHAFDQSFKKSPVVFTSIVSTSDASAIISRAYQSSKTGFTLSLQEEEAADQTHADETVHFIAIEPSMGQIAGRQYEVIRSANRMTHQLGRINYKTNFAASPLLFAHTQTLNGKDPANVRVYRSSYNHSLLWVDEEQSKDQETGHISERVGIMVVTP